jgi:phosphoribosylamine--glycine ligase
MRLRTDLLDLIEAVVDERLDTFEGKLEWDPRPAVCVVMASGGYPGNYEKGLPIRGLADAAKLPDVKVFHAGTRRDGDRILTDAGRVVSVTALGDTLADAKRRAYEAVACIHFPGAFYRRDIADKALRSLAAAAADTSPSAMEPPKNTLSGR